MDNFMKKVVQCFILFFCFSGQFCYAQDINLTGPSDQQAPVEQSAVEDPYEKFNRVMFAFNDKLDTYLLKPVATFYNTIMPKPLNQGVHNFFLNIGNLPTIANDLLQFNFYQMANDVWRLGVNTTAGIGGIFDVAGRIGLKPYANDFGLTLATWGFDQSNYLVLPFFGPNTVRDAIGIPVDYYVFSIYPRIKSNKARYAIYGLGVIDRRAQLLQFQSVMEEASLDKYVFIRNAYLQRRAYLIDQNQHLSFASRGWTPYREVEAAPDKTVEDKTSLDAASSSSSTPVYADDVAKPEEAKPQEAKAEDNSAKTENEQATAETNTAEKQ